MSFMLFNDNLCGHPFSNSFIAPSLNQCWRTTWGARSLYIANLPACENGGTPTLWVAASGGCWTNWGRSSGGEGEQLDDDDDDTEKAIMAKRQNMPGMCLSSSDGDANSMYWYSFSDTATCHTLPCQQAIQYTKFVCSGAAYAVTTSDSTAMFAIKTPIVVLFLFQMVLVASMIIYNALEL
ncbi:hypothetical protein PFICI_02545 [Pestalotiopsis fici W106-1]|uniref:Uncharacterized protein n=1 Tax=Pestalotiopsis fici (strain W106-1 / CGMCC3.15140) TaxID=1229662 RepID=W3XEP3_PESFW|nr:uncharacterized protein PFICI_02545 [Pestalotiopsis fici W106-1]ETS84520.1 hypothetical protein PFICI_02545 [Pestalotiopsis fici W106-1]